ncbi:DNA end-binding protein Ku [Asanoa hainanensis]|uniref:Non-homologous end joining protein Ku n=1 Tax=Asanoa hainanensis TaxID=560556 RepID=A0A239GKD6_9ACTN|nr:Ku protein [Asanoa hainanensis]SNS69218.1 DNA end-binding protein Ku [Asanoa hainanensis]
MARPIWSGVISFGLVAVPVRMYSATREHEVSFHQFEKGTSDRIRYQRVNERTGKEVEYADIVKGADVGGGDYVILDPDELDSIAPGRSRSLEIHTFVDLDEIDPISYQKAYYLGPGREETGRTYALLRDAMADANRAAIGTLVMRGKEYLTAIRGVGDVLVLQTMYFADEVRDPSDIGDVPGKIKLKSAEISMAGQLIDSMTGGWKHEEYRDTFTDRVNELIEAKHAGQEITATEAAPAATGVSDLMDVLRRSVEDARSRRGSAKKAPARKSTAKKAPAKKTAAKKAPAKKTTTAKKAATKGTTKKAAAKKTTAKKSGRRAA